jgi:hypothetical protein
VDGEALVINDLLVLVDAAVLGLAVLLVFVILSSSGRYRDRRFLLVGMAILALGALGAGGLSDALWTGSVPGMSGGLVISLFLLFSEGCLYLSLLLPRVWKVPTGPG